MSATPITMSEMLEALRNESHDDLDDKYAGSCECGKRLFYIREDGNGNHIPRGQRILSCRAGDSCPV
jgi:hypothetical protein